MDLPKTQQQAFSSQQDQEEIKQQNMLPQNQLNGNNALYLQRKEKEYLLGNISTEPSTRVTAGDKEITQRDKCEASSHTATAAKHRNLSSSPYRSPVRRRRQSENRSHDQKSRQLNETSDEDFTQPTFRTRGREGRRREEKNRQLGSEHFEDNLHQRLQHLESRFSDMESVTKNVHEILTSVLSIPVLQSSLKSVQELHMSDARMLLYEGSPHQELVSIKQPHTCQEQYAQQSKGGNQQIIQLKANHQQPISQEHPQFHLPKPEIQQSLLQQPQLQKQLKQQQPQQQQQQQPTTTTTTTTTTTATSRRSRPRTRET